LSAFFFLGINETKLH